MTLFFRCIRILYALCVNDPKGRLIPPQVFVPYLLHQFLQHFVQNADPCFVLLRPNTEMVLLSNKNIGNLVVQKESGDPIRRML